MEDNKFAIGLELKPPKSELCWGDTSRQLRIEVDAKFNWFQKKMLKWCFNLNVEEH